MEYEESERSGYSQREETNWAEGVHIRQENRGIMMYAVFDGEEQVSDEYAPAEDNLCIEFATAYSKGVKNSGYGFARDYEDRRTSEMSELTSQTEKLVTLAFNNIEYILGNADFEDTEVSFDKLETLRDALWEMHEYVSSESFLNLERR